MTVALRETNTVVYVDGVRVDTLSFDYRDATGELALNGRVILPAARTPPSNPAVQDTGNFYRGMPYYKRLRSMGMPHVEAASNVNALLDSTGLLVQQRVESMRQGILTEEDLRRQLRDLLRTEPYRDVFDTTHSFRDGCPLCLRVVNQKVDVHFELVVPVTQPLRAKSTYTEPEAEAYAQTIVRTCQGAESKLIILHGADRIVISGGKRVSEALKQIEGAIAGDNSMPGPLPARLLRDFHR